MIDIKNLTVLLDQIAEEKGLQKERVMEAIEQAIAAAYKKEYGQRGQAIKAKINTKTGKVDFWQLKLVVDKDMIYSDEELEQMKEAREKGETWPLEEKEEKEKIRFNPERHIMLADAKKEKSDAVTAVLPLRPQSRLCCRRFGRRSEKPCFWNSSPRKEN